MLTVVQANSVQIGRNRHIVCAFSKAFGHNVWRGIFAQAISLAAYNFQ
jgi:hypothetical protein